MEEGGFLMNTLNKERSEPDQMPDSYLGDGLYASFDGFQIVLTAPRVSFGADHFVALEPSVFSALLRYADEINKKYETTHFDLKGERPR